MIPAREIVRDFYHKLSTGDASGALDLMAPDVEWTTMWHYRVDGRGPQKVAEDLFKPLIAEWSSFALVPTEFIAEGGTVVSLGDFTGVHRATGKTSRARYPTSGPFVTARSPPSASTSTLWPLLRRGGHEPRKCPRSEGVIKTWLVNLQIRRAAKPRKAGHLAPARACRRQHPPMPPR
jgi:ketosteroid isomerase-like protein